jgi:hypothetical protein
VDQSVTVQRVNTQGSVQISVYRIDEYDEANAFMLRLICKDQTIHEQTMQAASDVLFCETRKLDSPDT